MTEKENESLPPTTKKASREVSTTDIDVLQADKKNVFPWASVDVFQFERNGEPTGFGLNIDGVPHLLWTHVYQNLEMAQDHSVRVLSRLEKDKHYISLSNAQMKEIKGRYDVTSYLGYSSSVYHFVTEEGCNRVMMEVDTSRMKDREAAANIEARKNEMAEIFTRYKRGEVLSLKGETQRKSPKYVPAAGILRDCVRQAKTIELTTGCSHKDAVMQCVLKADLEYKRHGGSGLEHLIQLVHGMPEMGIGSLPDPTGDYYSATQIAKELGLPSAQVVNRYLDKFGYQESKGKIHTPTELGLPYAVKGVSQFTRPNGSVRVETHWYWRREMVDILRIRIEGEQTKLIEEGTS